MANQKMDFHTEVPALLMRRIAEAADGHRGAHYWFVFSVDDENLPNNQRGKFISKGHKKQTEADKDLEHKPNRHRIGPFYTDAWADRRRRQISRLQVTTQNGGSTEGPLDLSVTEHDALFWTEAAVDKFVIPYYVPIYGPEYGVTIKKAFNDPLVYALTHLPGSEYASAVVPTETTLRKLAAGGDTGELEVVLITPDWEQWWAARLARALGPATGIPEGVADA